MARKKARKSSVKKKLKLRKKPLGDLPVKKTRAATVKGGTVAIAPSASLPAQPQTYAPPYTPVAPQLFRP